MQYGEQKIGGAWYYLNPVTGARKTGWQYLNSNGGKTVYYGSDGKMVYGTQYIDGQKYYFDPVTGAKRQECARGSGRYLGFKPLAISGII